MKRTLLFLFVAATLFSIHTQAQIPGVKKVTAIIPKVMFGAKVGADFSGLSGSTWKQSYTGGFVGGLFLGLHGKKFGIQGEALIHSAKFEVSSSQNNPSVSTVNLDVPVLIEYKIVPRIWFQLGPQFSDVISEKDNNLGASKNVLKSTDFDGVVGLQAILPLHFVVSARYIIGLTDINNHVPNGPTESWKNKAFQLSVGFRFL